MRQKCNKSLVGLAVPVAICAIAACSSSSGPRASTSTTSGYHPTIRAADFSADVDNPWFPLAPGSLSISRGTRDGKPARDVVTVTHRTKVIDGVQTRVVEDRLYLDGTLAESTTDYYTQDKSGTVWYFGEDTETLDANGKVLDREGTWHSGVDGAQPGVFMEANPTLGHTFRQEYYAGHAEDHYAVIDLSTPVRVPAGSYSSAMLTKEWTPLEPDVLDHKYYVRGIGEVREVSVRGATEALNLVTRSAGATPR
jgi:hypothetical protein